MGRSQYCIPGNATAKGSTNNTNVSICVDSHFEQSTAFKENFKNGLVDYWKRTGQTDGQAGRLQRDTTQYAKIYSSLGITYNPASDYTKKWKQGLDKYCTFELGQNSGQNGNVYNIACDSSNNKDQYKAGWNKGSELFQKQTCTPCQGYSYGLIGKPLPALCNNPNYNNMITLYNEGNQMHTTINSQKAETQRKRNQINSINLEMTVNTKDTFKLRDEQAVLQQQLNDNQINYKTHAKCACLH